MGHSLCAWCQVLGLGLYLPKTGSAWGAEVYLLTSSDLDQLVSRRPQVQIDATGEQGAHTANWEFANMGYLWDESRCLLVSTKPDHLENRGPTG